MSTWVTQQARNLLKIWCHAGIVSGQRYNGKGEVLYHLYRFKTNRTVSDLWVPAVCVPVSCSDDERQRRAS